MTGPAGDVARFERRFFDPSRRITRIGNGSLGGKAQGLVTAARILDERRADLETPGLSLDVPALCVVATSVFDAFLDRNGLQPLVAEEPSDEVIAIAFRKATLPAEWLGDLRSLAADTRVPLACRSSSALEDALGRPFAGVYGTKMIPGNQADPGGRFKGLTDALKFVFATTFLSEARAYRRAAGSLPEPEKMAVEVPTEDLHSPLAVVASSGAMGNGRHEVRDIVYVEPAAFEPGLTPVMAGEIEPINRALEAAGRPYLLIGFGRWGSTEPWLGIPVRWDQISGARGIVEATLPRMNPEPSQGSHFFHNLSSFSVLYFTVPLGSGRAVEWEWLARQEAVTGSEHVRHVRTAAPLILKVDGRSRRGVAQRMVTP